jgi:hypothetical protein
MMELVTGGLFQDLPYDDLWLLRAHISSIVRELRSAGAARGGEGERAGHPPPATAGGTRG